MTVNETHLDVFNNDLLNLKGNSDGHQQQLNQHSDLLVSIFDRDTGHFARYYTTVNQPLVTATGTRVKLETADATTPDVTPNSTFDLFTLNKTGLWIIAGGVRYGGSSAAGSFERLTAITDGGVSPPNRYASFNTFVGQNQVAMTPPIAVMKAFTAGQTVALVATQQSGVTISNGVDGVNNGQQTHLALLWVRPLT